MADLIAEFLHAVDGAGERVIPESALAGGVAEEQQAQFDAFLAQLEAAGLIVDVSPAEVGRRFVHVAVTDAGRRYVADQGA
jgi:DNA-binding MarR family transcriptional regulator